MYFVYVCVLLVTSSVCVCVKHTVWNLGQKVQPWFPQTIAKSPKHVWTWYGPVEQLKYIWGILNGSRCVVTTIWHELEYDWFIQNVAKSSCQSVRTLCASILFRCTFLFLLSKVYFFPQLTWTCHKSKQQSEKKKGLAIIYISLTFSYHKNNAFEQGSVDCFVHCV